MALLSHINTRLLSGDVVAIQRRGGIWYNEA